MVAVVAVLAVEKGRRAVGVRWEVKRRRRGRTVDGVKKLKARMTSETSIRPMEDFEREMPGCIGR